MPLPLVTGLGAGLFKLGAGLAGAGAVGGLGARMAMEIPGVAELFGQTVEQQAKKEQYNPGVSDPKDMVDRSRVERGFDFLLGRDSDEIIQKTKDIGTGQIERDLRSTTEGIVEKAKGDAGLLKGLNLDEQERLIVPENKTKSEVLKQLNRQSDLIDMARTVQRKERFGGKDLPKGYETLNTSEGVNISDLEDRSQQLDTILPDIAKTRSVDYKDAQEEKGYRRAVEQKDAYNQQLQLDRNYNETVRQFNASLGERREARRSDAELALERLAFDRSNMEFKNALAMAQLKERKQQRRQDSIDAIMRMFSSGF